MRENEKWGHSSPTKESLVHNHFVLLLYLFIIYYVFAEIFRSGHSRHAVTASESYSEPQSYRKSHEKDPDKTENRMPGVKHPSVTKPNHRAGFFGEISTCQVEHQIMFVGKDVGLALGDSKPENAIANHVDTEYKTTALIQGTGSTWY